MEKVYILTSQMAYENVQVVHGVYSSLEKAEKEMKKLLKEETVWYDFEIEESLFIE